MREHSTLFIILSCVFVSLAIVAGFQLYSIYELSSNRNAIMNTIHVLAEDAYQFRQRPVALGGGGGDYSTYRIPYKLIRTPEGIFTIEPTPNRVFITGLSRPLNARIEAEVDETGNIVRLSFEGEFR